MVERIERHQIVLYLAAVAVGLVVGLALPSVGPPLAGVINLVLALLLYVTFVQVPMRAVLTALRDLRFVAAVVVVNFVVVPLVTACLFVLLPDDRAIHIGVVLVMMCPCVDYVIVFSGLAGGDNRRLLATTPVLLILQMVLLPVFLFAFLGRDLGRIVDVRPFVEALCLIIVAPLVLAWATQWWAAKYESARRVSSGASALMVPLMVAVLGVVAASQVSRLDGLLGRVVVVVPFYTAFVLVMVGVGWLAGLLWRLDVSARRAVVFSGVTRNSLVVLPLALSLPPGFELAGAVVVIQTLVELVAMGLLVRVVPRLIPAAA